MESQLLVDVDCQHGFIMKEAASLEHDDGNRGQFL